MAYAALVFLEKELEKLLPHQNAYIHLYEKEQMESLHSDVIFLQKILEDFPGTSSLIKQLESQITDVAYELSDIIGWGISHGKHQKKFKACIKRVDFFVENAKDIRKVLEMKTNLHGHDSPLTSSSSTVPAPGGENIMVGLDTDLSRLKERIVGRNTALQIIPITGMGGIGKTTLAKSVYEDPTIKAHFDVRFWVTVSQEHNTEKILKEILGDTKKKDKEPLIVSVHKKLTGRRFLIVMDDIWNVEAWDSVRNAFPDCNKGSRVVITTRLIEVAKKSGSSSQLHEMRLLNGVQSWELFQKEAFGHEYCPSQLENIGKTISKSCKGLPLAIVVIARLLKLNRTEDYWEKFVRNMHEAMAEATHDDQLMKILSLSYDNLPAHLKACFLYMCMFPEDAHIPTKKLKWLWVAEGFLKPTIDKSMEEVAEKCLLDLVDRNLLSSIRKRSSNGSIRFCTVHDLLRDLSLRKSQEEKFSQQIFTLTASSTKRIFQKHMPCFKDQINSQLIVYRRCVGIYTPANSCFFRVNKTNYGYVYSLICHRRIYYEDMLPTTRSNLVRVLDVLKTPFQSLMSFGVNLRYLAFVYTGGYNDFKATLANVRKLQNLETLIINHGRFYELIFFPVLEMPKLKHFVVQPLRGIYCLIDNRNRESVSNKSLLKTLSGVLDLQITRDEIKLLANLVKLKINYDEYTSNRSCLYNLVFLHELENLNLSMDRAYSELPTNIAFPDRLKKITLGKFIISWETMSVMGSLPNLQVLKLVGCHFESSEWEPVEGEFQQLRYLKLNIGNLVEWKVESIHFPCIEQLILSFCGGLKEVPSEVGEINTLHKLVIEDCMKCVGDSAREIKKDQQRYGNYQLQVVVKRPFKHYMDRT